MSPQPAVARKPRKTSAVKSSNGKPKLAPTVHAARPGQRIRHALRQASSAVAVSAASSRRKVVDLSRHAARSATDTTTALVRGVRKHPHRSLAAALVVVAVASALAIAHRRRRS